MIRLDRDGGRWTVTLDRPDRANALTAAMLAELARIFALAREDEGLRVLVVTGAGERVFSAGADLDEARQGDLTTSPLREEVSNSLASLPVLTIAALNGTLAGGAFGMALACDLRIAVPEARFFYPVLKNGFLPQPSDVRRLNRLIGPGRARLILMAGQKLTADEALAFGLIERIVPRDEMAGLLDTLSADALAGRPQVLAAIKALGRPHVDAATRADCLRAAYHDDGAAFARLKRP